MRRTSSWKRNVAAGRMFSAGSKCLACSLTSHSEMIKLMWMRVGWLIYSLCDSTWRMSVSFVFVELKWTEYSSTELRNPTSHSRLNLSVWSGKTPSGLHRVMVSFHCRSIVGFRDKCHNRGDDAGQEVLLRLYVTAHFKLRGQKREMNITQSPAGSHLIYFLTFSFLLHH